MGPRGLKGASDPIAMAFRRAVKGFEPLLKVRCRMDVAVWDLEPTPVEPLESPGEVRVALNLLEHAMTKLLPDGRRRADLEADLLALRTLLRIVEGEEVPYLERVRGLIQCPPTAPSQGELLRLRSEVEEAARGAGLRGDLEMAIPRWEASDMVTPGVVEEEARATLALAWEATRGSVGLPPGEEVELESVRGQPWSGFSDYQTGTLKSIVKVNLDVPWTRAELRYLMVHEAYPGHHTDSTWKVHHFRAGDLDPDRAISFSGSPEGPISEGIGDYGIRVIGWNGSVDRLAYALGLYRSALALTMCIGVWERGWERAEAVRHAVEEGFTTEPRAAHAWEFITHPVYGPHAFSYYYGTRAVEAGHRAALQERREGEFLHLLYARPHTLAGLKEALAEELGLHPAFP